MDYQLLFSVINNIKTDGTIWIPFILIPEGIWYRKMKIFLRTKWRDVTATYLRKLIMTSKFYRTDCYIYHTYSYANNTSFSWSIFRYICSTSYFVACRVSKMTLPMILDAPSQLGIYMTWYFHWCLIFWLLLTSFSCYKYFSTKCRFCAFTIGYVLCSRMYVKQNYSPPLIPFRPYVRRRKSHASFSCHVRG